MGDINSVDKFASLDLSNSRVIALPATYNSTVSGDLARGDRIDLMYTNGNAAAKRVMKVKQALHMQKFSCKTSRYIS